MRKCPNVFFAGFLTLNVLFVNAPATLEPSRYEYTRLNNHIIAIENLLIKFIVTQLLFSWENKSFMGTFLSICFLSEPVRHFSLILNMIQHILNVKLYWQPRHGAVDFENGQFLGCSESDSTNSLPIRENVQM